MIRWFVRDGDSLAWADSREELIAQFPLQKPKSATFIPASVYDNQKLLAKDPGYLANLMAQPRVERERLLGGNWKVVASPRDYFRREWFPIVDVAPVNATRVRWWDFAATAVSTTRKNDPDYTVGVRMARTPDGRIYVEDIRRVRTTPAGVEALVLQTAQLDGPGVATWIEQEPGSSGVTVDRQLREALAGIQHPRRTQHRAERGVRETVLRAMRSGQCLARAGRVEQRLSQRGRSLPDGRA